MKISDIPRIPLAFLDGLPGGFPPTPDGVELRILKRLFTPEQAELAMDAAACIGCGACIAACPNACAMLFLSAKVSHFALLPQGQPEAAKRAISMLRKMDELGFGSCGNKAECEAVCPKEISIRNIARFNREFLKATFGSSEE